MAAALTELGGGHGGDGLKAGAAGAVTASLAGPRLVRALYGKEDMDGLSPDEKRLVSNLVSVIGGIAGYTAGDTDIAMAAIGANAARVEVENNLLGATSSDKLEKVIEKIKNGDKTLATANDLIKLENADKRSDALISKYLKDPSQMSSAEQAELATYLRIYASEMEKEYGQAVSQELVKGLLSGQDYIKRNPDSEAMAKAQNIMNTWGYHKSNASIGDSALLFGSSVLGITIKEGMALNAAIGVGVNTGVQLYGDDPFSYVDVILSGVTAAASTGKSWQASAAINMGVAAIGSGIKGEDPTSSVIGSGFGSATNILGKGFIDSLFPVTNQVTKDVFGTVVGNSASELTGKHVKDKLDNQEKMK
ncbi:VENN motif pre-toxin domain-containing protein [Edwardsiella ictaluri]|uniref:VENN motif pre-toxin domain-containing protein n=1 Tax=Edwardsiella ictaluri TaxID=67780 RepID=UPI0037836247